jgi:[ribosomal protein S5]-alanine N-acetyltransferase
MELMTRRFLLRDFVKEDATPFAAYRKDLRFLEFYGPAEADPRHATDLVRRFRAWAAEEPRLNYQLAIVHRERPHELLGCCGLRRGDAPAGTAELGIELAPSYWGRYGYAKEILEALADYGFRALELEAIYGRAVDANSRIGRLISVLGAEPADCSTPPWMQAKGWSQLEWRLTRNKWKSSKPYPREELPVGFAANDRSEL